MEIRPRHWVDARVCQPKLAGFISLTAPPIVIAHAKEACTHTSEVLDLPETADCPAVMGVETPTARAFSMRHDVRTVSRCAAAATLVT